MSESAVSADSRIAPPFRLATPTGIAAGAILLFAAALRILGADGGLWLDEIWSLALIDEIRERQDFFWGLTIDNNHYLNTLWLYLVGADAPVLVQRGFSIALGLVTVAVAGFAFRGAGAAGVLAAMGLFAVSYPMVNYGSEARGYAGLILMTLLAFLLTESATAGSTRDRRRLGVVNVLGVLFQPIMLGAIAGQMAWSAWISSPNGKPNAAAIRNTIATTAKTFSWTVRLLLPVAAVIAFSVLQSEGYRIAGTIAFTPAKFVEGYGGLLHLLLGLPDAAPDWLALPIGAALCALGWRLSHRQSPRRAALYLIFLVGLPLAMFVARLPNVQFPRYYLASAIVFLLLLVDLFVAAWNRGGGARLLGLALLIAIAIGNLADVWHLLLHGRDQSAAVVEMIGGSGPVVVSSDLDSRNGPIIEFYARRLNLPITYVPTAEICSKNPQWMLSTGSIPMQALDTSPVGCRKIFNIEAYFPQWGLSGLPWAVYRAE